MPPSKDLSEVADWMRRDWNGRALEDAERFVYTRDADTDESDFTASGRANYNQLVRPYLPVLLNGAAPRDCKVLEIGCGLGRMTRWFAESFAEVHGTDISPEMIDRARVTLAAHQNVILHVGSGFDLQPLLNAHFDLVFSYIVFQHIPSAMVIRNYIREASRVLKPGGSFKFQVNGDQSPEYRRHERDTWQGETFSLEEVREILDDCGLTLAAMEDPGTQYFVITARKAPLPDRRTYFLPGEPEDGGWRPMPPQSVFHLQSPPNEYVRLYAGIYLWPADPDQEHFVTAAVNGKALDPLTIRGSGDHLLEWTLRSNANDVLEIRMNITPPCARPHWPALRIVGVTPDARES